MNTSKSNSRLGFTLIELLAIIVVVTLFIATLIPALAGSQVRTQIAACLNNQKQLAMGWQMYGNDNNDLLVGMGDHGPHINPPDWFWRPGVGSGSFDWTSDPNAHVTTTQQACQNCDEWGYRQSALARYEPRQNIIHCPGDLRLNASGVAYKSYAGAGGLNQLIKTTAILHPANRFLWIEESDSRFISPIRIGSKTWQFGEHLGTWALISGDPGAPSFQPVLDNGWYDSPAAFHMNNATFSWADGHASAHVWQSAYTIAFANNPVAGRDGAFPKDGQLQQDLLFVANGYAYSNWP